MITPVASFTSRIRSLAVSAMKRSPAAVHRDAAGCVQFGGGGRTVVAAVARGAVAGDRGEWLNRGSTAVLWRR